MPMVVKICRPRPNVLRMCGGDSSFTYAPIVPVAVPEAIPAMRRPTAKAQMFDTEASTTPPTNMKMQFSIKVFLRPRRSLKWPQHSEPTMAPKIHAFTANVHSSFEWPGNMRHVSSATGRVLHSSVSLYCDRFVCDVDQPLWNGCNHDSSALVYRMALGLIRRAAALLASSKAVVALGVVTSV
ncbi:hypothetical protein PI125_g26387 [Phytophthora idaei]|nr:hypothetical protein PI125_g26387 [Phytophthora idaei]KAG3122350.1 hypothetical protein PI126_g24184 [Phytophthora idaei]